MKGRLENKIKIDTTIEKMLMELPSCVADYYYSRSSSKEPQGIETYIQKIRGFFRFLSDDTKNVDVRKITERDLTKYFKSIEVKTTKDGEIKETSFSHRKQVYSILSSFFDFLTRRRVISENPMACIEKPTSVDVINRIELDEYDFNLILQAVERGAGIEHAKNRQKDWKDRDRAIMLMFMNTGIRRTALTEINVEDVDFMNNTITVVDKRHKTHIYVMNNILRSAVQKWIEKRSTIEGIETDALFISSFKKRMNDESVAVLVKKYTREGLGFSVTPHALRAAFCTILYDNTHDIEKVRDAVGHSSISTTQRYIVKDNSAKEESADIMERVFEKGLSGFC